jgi:hypothetical protein
VATLRWLAAGGILLFAVSGHPAFINLQLVGLILLARGIVGLWMNIGRERRARYKDNLIAAAARGTRAVEAFISDLARDEGTRVPLADLLAQPGRRDRPWPDGPASTRGQQTR